MEYDVLLELAADMGCRLMTSGAEIYRVEESMQRILNAYGLSSAEVFAIPNCIIVSVTTPEGRSITRMRRIAAHGTDIELLERCNSLCRRLCTEVLPLPEARALLAEIPREERHFSLPVLLLGYGLAPMFFTAMFGGTLFDAVSAFLIGVVIGLLQFYGTRLLPANSFVRTAFCSAVASFLSPLFVHLGFGAHIDLISIGALMLLVPGVAITNAMREIMAGDTISAISQMSDALLCAVAIALGAAVGFSVGRML
ncbi:MAG: threonine/serine exporter family protein [Oscillospiraceae bacterium]|nr:threonine/serine exporter family protein [Oscillospiraceae bacterium]